VNAYGGSSGVWHHVSLHKLEQKQLSRMKWIDRPLGISDLHVAQTNCLLASAGRGE